MIDFLGKIEMRNAQVQSMLPELQEGNDEMEEKNVGMLRI